MRVFTINGCRVESDRVDELRDLLSGYAREVRANEPGCTSLRVLEDVEGPGSVIVFAEFVDDEAYQAHLDSAHVARLRERLHPLMGDTHHKTIYRSFE